MAAPASTPQPVSGTLETFDAPGEVVLLSSAARTVTNSVYFSPGRGHGIVEIDLVVTAGTSLSITPSIEIWDPGSETWITVLTGTASTGVATQRLSVGPHAPVTSNVAAQCALAPHMRLTLTHGNATAATYSAGAHAS